MEQLQVSATFPSISPDAADQLKQLAAQALATVRGEPGTLRLRSRLALSHHSASTRGRCAFRVRGGAKASVDGRSASDLVATIDADDLAGDASSVIAGEQGRHARELLGSSTRC